MDVWLFRVWDIRLLWMFLYRFCMGIWDFCLLFFIFLPYFYQHADIQLLQHYLKQRLSLSIELPLQSQLSIHVCVYFWIFFFIPLIRLSVFMSVPLSVGYWSFIKNRAVQVLLLFKIVLIAFRSFAFPCESWNQFIHFDTKACWEFDWGCTDSVQQLGENWYRNKAEFSNPWT